MMMEMGWSVGAMPIADFMPMFTIDNVFHCCIEGGMRLPAILNLKVGRSDDVGVTCALSQVLVFFFSFPPNPLTSAFDTDHNNHHHHDMPTITTTIPTAISIRSAIIQYHHGALDSSKKENSLCHVTSCHFYVFISEQLPIHVPRTVKHKCRECRYFHVEDGR
jgi:hypothetical protein